MKEGIRIRFNKIMFFFFGVKREDTVIHTVLSQSHPIKSKKINNKNDKVSAAKQ